MVSVPPISLFLKFAVKFGGLGVTPLDGVRFRLKKLSGLDVRGLSSILRPLVKGGKKFPLFFILSATSFYDQ